MIYERGERPVGNICGDAQISEPWAQAIEWLLANCKKYFSRRLHSFYVRGSIARDTAFEGISDIDCVCLLHDDPTEIDLGYIDALECHAQSKFVFCTGVEIYLCNGDSMLYNQNISGMRFLIKVTARCIFGRDISDELCEYTFKSIPLTDTSYIIDSLKFLEETFIRDISNEDTLRICRWIMKCLIRFSYEINVIDETVYSRDIIPCYISAIKYFPEIRNELRNAVNMIIRPTNNTDQIMHVAGRLVATLVPAARGRMVLR